MQAAATNVTTACCSPQNGDEGIQVFPEGKNYFQFFFTVFLAQYFPFSVTGGKSSVRNGDAGRPAPFERLHVGLSDQA